MTRPRRRKGWVLLGALALGLLLAGCASPRPAPSPSPSAAAPTAGSALAPYPLVAATLSPYPPPAPQAATLTATSTATPNATFTAAPSPTIASTNTLVPLPLPTRLPAAAWKQWPVIPELTNRARAIYQQGRMQNNARAFSKVGDCQGIKEVWLGVYDQPGLYSLSPENAALQETIEWFAGSFNRNGYAVMGGYNARAVLSPTVADPAACQPGESPIECEYRLHRPSIVLVSLEFYYEGRTAKNYEAYLRQVLDFFIARGTLPILATKADNMEGDESLNLTTARLALEYDLPLWNFWRAVQPLPNHGMDLTRPDGFHISVDAWRVRSVTSLQALDAIWRGVRELTCFAAGSQACFWPNTQKPTPTAVPPLRPSTRLVLSLAERAAVPPGDTHWQGVFAFDTETQILVRLLGEGTRLQDVSPDGTQLLVNRGSRLYLAETQAPERLRLLADDFYPYGERGAAWLGDGQSLVMILQREDGRALWQMAAASGALQRLTPAEALPHELRAGPNRGEVFWAEGGCTLDEHNLPIASQCRSGGWFRSSTGGDAPLSLTAMLRPLRSPDGRGLAYSFLDAHNQAALALTASDRPQVWIPLPPGSLLDAAWSPSGRWLAALWQERSDYSGKITAQSLYLLNPLETRSEMVPLSFSLNGLVRWSPDGRWLLVSGTESSAAGYRVTLRLIPANGGSMSVFDGKMAAPGENFVYVSEMMWLP